jgi:hypothetical protein
LNLPYFYNEILERLVSFAKKTKHEGTKKSLRTQKNKPTSIFIFATFVPV